MCFACSQGDFESDEDDEEEHQDTSWSNARTRSTRAPGGSFSKGAGPSVPIKKEPAEEGAAEEEETAPAETGTEAEVEGEAAPAGFLFL